MNPIVTLYATLTIKGFERKEFRDLGVRQQRAKWYHGKQLKHRVCRKDMATVPINCLGNSSGGMKTEIRIMWIKVIMGFQEVQSLGVYIFPQTTAFKSVRSRAKKRV